MVRARITPAGTIGKVTVQQNITTSIADPKYKPKPNVSLSELTDVDISILEDGDALVYDAANTKFITKKVEFKSTGNLSSNLNLTGNITPTIDNFYYLGSEQYRWHSLYVGPGSVDIDGIVLGNTGTGLVIASPGQTPVEFNQVANNASEALFVAETSVDAIDSLTTTVQSVSEVVNVAIDIANLAFEFANTVQGNDLLLGFNTQGNFNISGLNPEMSITDGIAILNQFVGRLIPPSPPAFPGNTSLVVSDFSTYRMCDFSQGDNTNSGRNVPGGTIVTNVRRDASYNTNNFNDVGPGNQGFLNLYKNGSLAGTVAFSEFTANGTYDDITISDNKDYSLVTGDAPGFWYSFDAQANGIVNPGWNEIYFSHTSATDSDVAYWYYDSSAPGTPTFSNATITPAVEILTYSSTIPHYSNNTTFNLSVDVNKLSGDMFPVSDTFFTGVAAGSFSTPLSKTYTDASIPLPLSRDLFVSSGSATVNTQANITSGFGFSSSGPTVRVDNSYSIGSHSFTSALANVVLRKTGTSSLMEESSITFGSTIGVGSNLASRVINFGNSDTPSFTNSASVFDSQNSTLYDYDATIVGGILKHDQTNYSVGHLPVGPNLSSGRSGAQYFTFKFVRSSVSKFNIKFTGTISGMWVALPGSDIDNTSSLNGWLDMSRSYAGSGIPGINSPGNGSNGCALGGTVTLNTFVTNHSKTCTFGTISSSSTTTNEIYVRIKLTNGQSITALSLESASN